MHINPPKVSEESSDTLLTIESCSIDDIGQENYEKQLSDAVRATLPLKKRQRVMKCVVSFVAALLAFVTLLFVVPNAALFAALVSGATGFLGTSLVLRFSSAGQRLADLKRNIERLSDRGNTTVRTIQDRRDANETTQSRRPPQEDGAVKGSLPRASKRKRLALAAWGILLLISFVYIVFNFPWRYTWHEKDVFMYSFLQGTHQADEPYLVERVQLVRAPMWSRPGRIQKPQMSRRVTPTENGKVNVAYTVDGIIAVRPSLAYAVLIRNAVGFFIGMSLIAYSIYLFISASADAIPLALFSAICPGLGSVLLFGWKARWKGFLISLLLAPIVLIGAYIGFAMLLMDGTRARLSSSYFAFAIVTVTAAALHASVRDGQKRKRMSECSLS